MRLVNVSISRFRGYRNTVTIDIEPEITTFIGRNDHGKSTILDALSIFFDDSKPEATDMNCFAERDGEDNFQISCEFDEIPTRIILDDAVETNLREEYLLNGKGRLEIIRTYKSINGKLDKTAIRCLQPTVEIGRPLLNLKLADLRAIGADVKNAVVDQRVSSHWRSAIRSAYESIEYSLVDIDISKISPDCKIIWEKIYSYLPIFRIFRADRESTDGDSEVKDPLQIAVKNALEEYKDQISNIENAVQLRVMDVAKQTIEKLREMSPDLADQLIPKFKDKPKWTFNFSLDGPDGIPINKRGSGVRRLILLNFFRAEAEREAAISEKNVIYAIEEPETSQHPNYQELLINSLLRLSSSSNRQIIITTHSPGLAGMVNKNGIRFVTKDKNGQSNVLPSNDDTLSQVVDSLGIPPALASLRGKGLVLVEGKKDVIFWTHASTTLKKSGNIPRSLEESKIVITPVGGSGSLQHWWTMNIVHQLGLPWVATIDRDTKKPEKFEQLKSDAERAGGKLHVLRKREIENYICPQLIQEASGQNVAYTDTDDAKKIITSMTGKDPIEYFWVMMDAAKIINLSTYTENGVTHSEILDMMKEFIDMVR